MVEGSEILCFPDLFDYSLGKEKSEIFNYNFIPHNIVCRSSLAFKLLVDYYGQITLIRNNQEAKEFLFKVRFLETSSSA